MDTPILKHGAEYSSLDWRMSPVTPSTSGSVTPEFTTPSTSHLDLLTPPTTAGKPKPNCDQTPRSSRSFSRRTRSSFCLEDVEEPSSVICLKRNSPEMDSIVLKKKLKPCNFSKSSTILPSITEETETDDGLKKRHPLEDMSESTQPVWHGLKRSHQEINPVEEMLNSPTKKLKVSAKELPQIGSVFRDSPVPEDSLHSVDRLDCTPKKKSCHNDYTKSSPSFREALSTSRHRLKFLKIGDNAQSTKKITTPKTPNKISSELMVGEKENSPIKIDFSESSSYLANLILKPPPRTPLMAPIVRTPEYRDILTELANRNMYLVIKQIFQYLSPLDLNALRVVSKSMKHTCEAVVSGSLREAVNDALISKENLTVAKRKSSKSLNETTPLKLEQVQDCIVTKKVALSPQFSPRTRRFRQFLQVRKELGTTEKISKCPRCSMPAKDDSTVSLFTECTVCSYKFCVKCRYQAHEGMECNYTVCVVTSPCKTTAVGSKRSKRALRKIL